MAATATSAAVGLSWLLLGIRINPFACFVRALPVEVTNRSCRERPAERRPSLFPRLVTNESQALDFGKVFDFEFRDTRVGFVCLFGGRLHAVEIVHFTQD